MTSTHPLACSCRTSIEREEFLLTVAALPRVGEDVEEGGLVGTAFIDRKMTVSPGKERILFSMPVSAISTHMVGATLFVDGPEDAFLTLTVRFLNGQRASGHVYSPESTVGAVQVADKPIPVPVPLRGENLLVPLSLRGWCDVKGGAGVRVQVVAGRKGGAGCGQVVVRSGFVSVASP